MLLTDYNQMVPGVILRSLDTGIEYKVLYNIDGGKYHMVIMKSGNTGVSIGRKGNWYPSDFRLKEWTVTTPFKEYYKRLQ